MWYFHSIDIKSRRIKFYFWNRFQIIFVMVTIGLIIFIVYLIKTQVYLRYKDSGGKGECEWSGVKKGKWENCLKNVETKTNYPVPFLHNLKLVLFLE